MDARHRSSLTSVRSRSCKDENRSHIEGRGRGFAAKSQKRVAIRRNAVYGTAFCALSTHSGECASVKWKTAVESFSLPSTVPNPSVNARSLWEDPWALAKPRKVRTTNPAQHAEGGCAARSETWQRK